MKICKEAEREKDCRLKSIVLNGAYYVNPAVGVVSSTAFTLFTPHRPRHEWVIITTANDSIYCIQFSRPDEHSKAEITVSHHSSEESANSFGARGIGNEAYHTVWEKKQTYNRTFQDVLNFLNDFDHNYNLVSNNCQTLSSELYAKFANLSINDIVRDRQRIHNTPGFTRGIDGSKNITCNVM